MVATLQKKFLEESYPSANHIHIKGADRQMVYKKPSAISQHLRRLVNQRQSKQQSQWPTAKHGHGHGFSGGSAQYVFEYSIKYLVIFLPLPAAICRDCRRVCSGSSRSQFFRIIIFFFFPTRLRLIGSFLIESNWRVFSVMKYLLS